MTRSNDMNARKGPLNSLLSTGVDDTLSSQAIKKIRLVNGFALTGFCVFIIGGMVAAVRGWPFHSMDFRLWFDSLFMLPNEWSAEITANKFRIIALVDVFWGSLLLAVICLNKRRMHAAAAVTLCGLATVIAFFYYYLVKLFFIYIVFIPAILPVIFFDRRRYYVAFAVLNYVALVVSTVIIFSYYGIYTQYNLYLVPFLTNVTGVYVSLFIIINYFKMENLRNENELERQNAVLQMQSEEIGRQHDEQLKMNETLRRYNDRIALELSMAKNIQKELIPSSSPVEYMSFLYVPMVEVGGDFIAFNEFRDDDRMGVFISDVSGHGVPAALITAMIKTAILQSGARREDPARLLEYLNAMLMGQAGGNFVTAFYGVYSRGRREMVYANAGHPRPLVVHGGAVESLGKGGLPLGIADNDELAREQRMYENHAATFTRDSRILLFTDGLTEAVHDDNRNLQFEETLHRLLPRLAGLPGPEIIRSVFEELKRFRGSDRFDDDICMICIEV